MKRDFLSIADWSPADLSRIIQTARDIKAAPDRFTGALGGKSVAMIFEKQSLRTHVTFDVGIHQLGGHAVYLTQGDISLGKRESVYDTAKNLERWVQAVVIRTFGHDTLTEFARSIAIPVINALDDVEHPCQAVGDLLTMREKLGPLKGKRLVYVGDGNNVCHSLLNVGARLGAEIRVATPAGFEPNADVVADARRAARETGGKIKLSHSVEEAVGGAQAIYTDVWASMGQEQEAAARAEIFASYQVNARLLEQAAPDAVFLHCLPAHRGLEVTDEVMDSPRSLVFDQAENRLHVQKAILLMLLS